jgi:hypothetical protein
MNIANRITTVFLVVVISMACVPCYMMEDASHNCMVDLEDAILQVQDLTEAADCGSFCFRFEKMLNTLSTVAGLKTLIAPHNESRTSKHQGNIVILPDKITNSFSAHFPPLLQNSVRYSESIISYESRTPDPSIPPPRIS